MADVAATGNQVALLRCQQPFTHFCSQTQVTVLTPVLLLQQALFLAAKVTVVAGMTWKSQQQER